MKIIKLIDGKEYVIDDEEIGYIKHIFPKVDFITLSNGEVINKSSISRIGDPDKIPHYHGYPLNKDGRSFIRDGERIYLEKSSFKEITHQEDPKYLTIPKFKVNRFLN